MNQRKSLYDTIPGLSRTYRDADHLPAIPRPHGESVRIAEAIKFRATRDVGPSPTAVIRRMLDEERRKHAATKPWADSAGKLVIGVLLIASCAASWSWVLR